MKGLIALLLFCGAVHAQNAPTCPVIKAPQNVRVMTWLSGPAVILQWCLGPNNTIAWWAKTFDPAQIDPTCLGKAPGFAGFWSCLAVTVPNDDVALDALISQWLPRMIVTNGVQPVVQVSAAGVVSPYVVNGIPQTVTRPSSSPCLGPGVQVKNQVLYSTLGMTSDQGNVLPGPATVVSTPITLPAIGVIWCYLTYPPTLGW